MIAGVEVGSVLLSEDQGETWIEHCDGVQDDVHHSYNQSSIGWWITEAIVGLSKNKDIMSWYILIIAGLFEIGWAIGLEYSDGLSNPVASLGTVGALLISMVLLAQAVKDLPVGTAYAVWTGIGAVGTASLGIVLFDESASFTRILFIGVIVVGIVGLHLSSGGH
mgnify:CR=1 FL=1